MNLFEYFFFFFNLFDFFWNKTGFLGLCTFSNMNSLNKGLLLQDWVFRLGIRSTVQQSRNSNDSISLFSALCYKLQQELDQPHQLPLQELCQTILGFLTCHHYSTDQHHQILKGNDKVFFFKHCTNFSLFQYIDEVISIFL